MTEASYDFDFAVAGGGPAGTPTAISLGQRGHSVILFERHTFPRFHIGESLPSTANDAFAALGVAERSSSFVHAREIRFQLRKGRQLLIRTHERATSRSFVFTQQLQREWNRR